MHLQSIYLNLIAIAGSFSGRRHRGIQRGEFVSWKRDRSHCTFPMCNDLRKNFSVGATIWNTKDHRLKSRHLPSAIICRFFVACIGVLMWSVKLWRFLSWRLGYIYIYNIILMCCPDTQPSDIEWIEVRGLSSRTDVLAINKELIGAWTT